MKSLRKLSEIKFDMKYAVVREHVVYQKKLLKARFELTNYLRTKNRLNGVVSCVRLQLLLMNIIGESAAQIKRA